MAGLFLFGSGNKAIKNVIIKSNIVCDKRLIFNAGTHSSCVLSHRVSMTVVLAELLRRFGAVLNNVKVIIREKNGKNDEKFGL